MIKGFYICPGCGLRCIYVDIRAYFDNAICPDCNFIKKISGVPPIAELLFAPLEEKGESFIEDFLPKESRVSKTMNEWLDEWLDNYNKSKGN